MARKVKVKGTKDFLVFSIGLALLGAWALKDGWYPSPSVLKKHPHSIEVSYEGRGIVTQVRAQPEQNVSKDEMLMVVRDLTKGEEQRVLADSAGDVKSVLVKAGDEVAPKQTLCVIVPTDHFYLFNKSLTFLCFIGALGCLIIHLKVR